MLRFSVSAVSVRDLDDAYFQALAELTPLSETQGSSLQSVAVSGRFRVVHGHHMVMLPSLA